MDITSIFSKIDKAKELKLKQIKILDDLKSSCVNTLALEFIASDFSDDDKLVQIANAWFYEVKPMTVRDALILFDITYIDSQVDDAVVDRNFTIDNLVSKGKIHIETRSKKRSEFFGIFNEKCNHIEEKGESILPMRSISTEQMINNENLNFTVNIKNKFRLLFEIENILEIIQSKYDKFKSQKKRQINNEIRR